MLEPLGPRLLIKPEKIEDIDPVFKKAKEAGIAMPHQSEELGRERAGIDKGIVVQLGSTAFRDFGGNWCNVGDYIAYVKHAGKYVTDPDTKEQMLIINDEDVVCKIVNTVEKDA